MATKDGLAQIWYADENGVITGYTPTADNVASAIIDTYNEHYGTDINIWTPETKTLQVGGTVPNWNTYEKIELPESKEYLGIAIDGGYAVGYLDNENIYLYSYTSSGNIIKCSHEGVVYLGGEVLNEELITRMSRKLNNAGIQFNEFIGTQTPYQPGETIENWENYRKIS